VAKLEMEILLRQMCDSGASDLLLTVGTPPQLRIHGSLEPFGTDPLHAEETAQLAYSLLNQQEVEKLKTRRSLDFSHGITGVARFRVNIYYQRDSIAMAIRVIPFEIPSFDELGIPAVAKEFALRPHGLILITGPAGSGKSTTVASMINHINDTRNVHIVCIEDPIEYIHAHRRSVIDQREIGEDAVSFSDALRSVFRQSPDVIMVGEMRDLETIALVLTLAETGHLIMATLHTQDTTHAVARIVDVFPTGQQQQVYTQLSQVLVGVISQQLIMTRDESARVLASEVMNVDNAIRNLIREKQVQQIYSVIQTGKASGMVTMNESLASLFFDDRITEEAALMRSPRPKELMRLLDR